MSHYINRSVIPFIFSNDILTSINNMNATRISWLLYIAVVYSNRICFSRKRYIASFSRNIYTIICATNSIFPNSS